ncbi:MAG TPA: hypothetical protein VF791_21920 [Pyrinomonadaceae bacterium]
MDKKRIVIFSCVAVLLAGAFTFSRNTSSKAVHQDLPPHAHPSQQSPVVPDYVVYNFLFHKVTRLREKTRELQAQGRVEQKPYFPLQREARLTEGQATALEAVAFACRQQVKQQDEKAKAIINAFQSRFPGGKVPEGGSPPPPPELKTMWEERNAMILRARDQLRAAFGEEEFARFDNYAKFHYGANKSPVTVNPVSPKSKQR